MIRHLGILALFIAIRQTLSVSSQDPDKIPVFTPNCNNEAVLPCTAKSYSHDYTSVIWYKVIQNTVRGIISKKNGHQKPVPYRDYAHITSLNEDYSLILKNVTIKDAGKYKCQINANVGGKNNNSIIMLNVSECVPPTTETPVPTTAQSTTGGWNGVSAAAAAAVQLVDVTSLRAFTGFITIGLTKVLLCALCVWGVILFKKHRRESSQPRLQR